MGARHFALATYWDQAVAHGPTSLSLAREQRVRDPLGDYFVVTVLIGWFPKKIVVVAGSPTPHWEEPVTRELLFQPCKEVIKVDRLAPQVSEPIREDDQADGLSR